MTNNTLINAAINEAITNLRALHPEDTDRLLDEAYAARGLKRRKRLTKEQRAALDQAEAQAKAQAQIDKIAAKAGLRVMVAHPVDVESPEFLDSIALVKAVIEAEDAEETDEDRAAAERFREAFENEPNPTMTVITIPE